MKLLISLAIAFLMAAGVFAQKGSVTAELQFFQDPPLKVEKLPMPVYPDIAKKAGLGGKVAVEVTVDVNGNVTSVDKVSGPYPVCQSVTDLKVMALRNSASEAAKRARFTQAVGLGINAIRGRIVYDFVPPAASKSTDWKDGGGLAVGDSDTGYRIADKNDTGAARVVDDGSLPKTVSGGVLNGTAMTLAKPSYPAAAKAVHASGSVSVQVLIVEDGTTFSAVAISGHPLLRSSSETAACSNKFSPTLLQGNPVKVSGVIVYNYVP